MAEPTLATALKQEIARRKLTGLQAAAELGVSQPTVSRWLGGSPPDDDRVPALAEFLRFPSTQVERLIFQARRTQREQRRTARGGVPSLTSRPSADEVDDDDDIELDFNSAMEHVPDEVRQAVIRIVKPYLEES